MNRKAILTLISVAVIAVCGAVITGGLAYVVLNNPTVKEGLDTAGSEFNAMLELRQKVMQTYQCEDAGVQIMNGNTLNISLINSEFNDMPTSQRIESAHEIAVFVKDNYTGKTEIERIVITFAENNQIGPINTNWSFSYPFNISELK